MRWFVFVLFAIVMACAQEDSSPFAELENEVSSNPTNSNVSQLLDSYTEWLKENPGISDSRHDILVKSAELSSQHIRYAQQLNSLQLLVLEYPADEETVDRLVEISDILDKLRRKTAAQATAQLIAQRYPGNPRAEVVNAKIPGDAPPVDTIIANLGRDMFDTETLRFNQAAAREYINACESYALVNPEDDASAELLHKAAETARNLGSIDKTIELYDWILGRYPNHKRTPQALFLKAFTYDSNLKDFETARKYYTEFLEKYPNDQFAPSAEFLLQNLGKDDEELLKTLQESNPENEQVTQ